MSKSLFGRRTTKKELPLSEDQRAVFDCASQGRSVFFSGSAGTGKSLLLRHIISRLREQYTEEGQVAVCAATGIAAVNIGGTTVHSWAGVGIGEGSPDSLLESVSKRHRTVKCWTRARALVIDEISMLDGALLDALEFIARKVRCNERVFGGLQLVLCGDFFQLPPIGLGKGKHWCFMATSWEKLVPQEQQFVLQHVFRQSEASFVALLDEVRYGGKLSPQTCNVLKATANNTFGGGIEPTRLCSMNVDVDLLNETRLEKLSGQLMSFAAADGGQQPYLSQIQKNCTAPDTLKLKVGAQVMLLKNIDAASGLVNGARGIVQGFEQGHGKPGLLGKLEREQEPGLPIVAMHTVSTSANGGGIVTRTIQREEWTVEVSGKVVAQRQQIPLRLAWAISIHKSQGMTIDALEADLGSIFEYGQAYVALSRATSLARLRVLNFDANRVKSDPQVVEFYRGLQKVHGNSLSASCASSSNMLSTKPAAKAVDSSAERRAKLAAEENAKLEEQEKLRTADPGYSVFVQDPQENARAEKEARKTSVLRRDEEVPEKKIKAALEKLWRGMSRLDKAPWNAKAKTAAMVPEKKLSASEATREIAELQRVEINAEKEAAQTGSLKETATPEFAELQQETEVVNRPAANEPIKPDQRKEDDGAAKLEPPAKKRKSQKSAKTPGSIKPGEAHGPVIDADVLQKAKTLGFEGQLKNLLSRPEILAKEFSQDVMLTALEESGGLVNKAKYRLLGA